jgi:serine/threonine protein kinase
MRRRAAVPHQRQAARGVGPQRHCKKADPEPMPLNAGTRLGAYEIVNALGAGGMGEVYRARDPKLGRDVAIKVLPDLFVDDPERAGRFQREAQVLAALNHPHIAVIYGLEQSGTTRFLAMELVEGESLAQHRYHARR